MKISPIRTKKQYQDALKRIDDIFEAKPNSVQGDELEILSILVESYEANKFQIDDPDPIEAIKFRMEQLGIDQTKLGEILGYKSRASEILNKKRKLSIEMIRKINEVLKIPADVLIKSY